MIMIIDEAKEAKDEVVQFDDKVVLFDMDTLDSEIIEKK